MSGIYAIINVASGRKYIGSSQDMCRRWQDHRSALRRGDHANPRLQRAWSKYGPDAFVFVILEETLDLLPREQFHLDAQCGHLYNVAIVAGCPTKGRKLSAETRQKMSIARMGHPTSEETKRKIGDANRKNVISPEHKLKLIAANLGRKASPETRAKMTAVRLGRPMGPCPMERRERIRQTLLGSKPTPEQRAKISAALLGRKRGPYKKRTAA